MQNPLYRCTGNGPGTHVDCPFTTDSLDEATAHFERFNHDVDELCINPQCDGDTPYHPSIVSDLPIDEQYETLTPADVTSKVACKRNAGFGSLITPEGYAPKTDKGRARGYSTAIMYFAPADLSGYDVCQHRSHGCTMACLNTAGHGGIAKHADLTGLNDIQRARVARTKLFFENRFVFNALLIKELSQHIARARAAGQIPCVRLNGTSDLPWERLRLNNGRTVLETFPDVQFYDYTKHAGRAIANARGEHPANYHLTFSRSEANELDAFAALHAGANVAVVLKICGCSPKARCKHETPDTGLRYAGRDVISGDHDDLRFLDTPGVWVGLKAKGKARIDPTGFTVDVRSWEDTMRLDAWQNDYADIARAA